MGDEIDKQQHYGRYMDQETASLNRSNQKADWRDHLDKKLRHKALDIPMDNEAEDDPLNVDNRRSMTSVNNSGIDSKTLGVAGVLALGAATLYTFAPDHHPAPQSPIVIQQPTTQQPAPIVQQPVVTQPQPIQQDAKFGIQVEVRDDKGNIIPINWNEVPNSRTITTPPLAPSK